MVPDGSHLHWTMALASPLVLLAIGGHLWSIPVWGPLGAAWTTSGTMLVGASTAYIAARGLGSVHLRFGSLARALFFGALGFGVSTIGPTGSAWLLVGLPGIGVSLVAIYGWWEGLITRECFFNTWRQIGRSAEKIA